MNDAIAAAVSAYGQASAMLEAYRFREAAAHADAGLRIFEAWCEPEHPDVANTLTLLATAEDELCHYATAEAHHRQAVEATRRYPHTHADLARVRVAAGLGLAGNLRRQARYAEAEQVYVEVLAFTDRGAGFGATERAGIWLDLGLLHRYTGRFDTALQHYETALAAAAHEPMVEAAVTHNLAGLAFARGWLSEAERHARRSLALHEAMFPPDHPALIADAAHLAAILQALGNLDEAEPLLRRALDYFESRYGAAHFDAAVSAHNLAAVLAKRGRADEATALYRWALDGKRAIFGAEHPEVRITLDCLQAHLTG